MSLHSRFSILFLIFALAAPSLALAKGKKGKAEPEPEPEPAAEPELPGFEWGGSALDADRLDRIRKYQNARLWTEDISIGYLATQPFGYRGRLRNAGVLRFGYAVRGGEHDWLGMIDLARVLGDEEAIAAYEAKATAQKTPFLITTIAGGGLTLGGLALGLGLGGRTANIDSVIQGIRNRQNSAACDPDCQDEADADLRSLQAERTAIVDLPYIGAGLAAAGAAVGMIGGLIYWNQRHRATNVWANMSRKEAREKIDAYNRGLAESLGLTEEEARLIEARYGYRPYRTPPSLQLAGSPGGVFLFGQF